jgi:flagellin
MQEIDNMVQRIRELVVYASNDTQDQSTTVDSAGDRRKIQDEIDALTQEIDSMANRVEFNKKRLINGSYTGGTTTEQTAYTTALTNLNNAKQVAIGLAAGSAWSNAVGQLRTFAAGQDSAKAVTVANKFVTDVETAFADALAATTREGVKNAETIMAAAKDALNTASGSFTATVNGWDVASIVATMSAAIGTAAYTGSTAVTVVGVGDAITNVHYYAMQLDKARSAVENASIGKLYFQVGANSNQGIETSIGSADTNTLGIGDGYGKSLIDVMETTGKATTYQLSVLDSALTYVTSQRSRLGALQNRLEYTQSSLDISAENLTNAESRIRDVDMAKEMTNFTKMNILFQASTAMLAQANALPQGVLQMLG